MRFATSVIPLSQATLPYETAILGIRLERHAVTGLKTGAPPRPMILVRPAARLLADPDLAGPEPRWNEIVCGMELAAGNGGVARGQGHLVITGHRFIGFLNKGTLGKDAVLEASESAFGFTIHRDDLEPPHLRKRRVMPSEFTFYSREQSDMVLRLLVFGAVAAVANGKTSYWYDQNMLRALSDEGRAQLL